MSKSVYTAEDRLIRWCSLTEEYGSVNVFGSNWMPEPIIKFGNIDSIQNYVNQVLNVIGCDRPVTVRTRKGHRKAVYETVKATIAIPDYQHSNGWAMNDLTALHELSHHLQIADGHGLKFQNQVVELLRVVNKPIAATMLQIAYSEAN